MPGSVKPFQRILIANRGEIAVRIARSCRELGIDTVAVFSDADAEALHVRLADGAVRLGAAPAAESYLSIERLLAAAAAMKVDAIHPGYGFLAENAEFARACEAAGFVFIGPRPDALERMGAKDAARALARSLEMPVVPGSEQLLDDAAARRLAEQLGFPVLLKATAGGGGTGMRVVEDAASMDEALESVRREAQAAFGHDGLILEKYLPQARHIEVQVLADAHGNRLHLYERECSIQRRRQKLIEEAPASSVPEAVRAQLREAALKLAAAVDYRGAGTVEFLVDEQGGWYFLEMNTRLQVEHPVTELVTGLDMVAWQIRIAEGERLELAQEDVPLRGHAIECRLCTEWVEQDFLPAAGEVAWWQAPQQARVDAGVETGSTVSVHYDSLAAKLVVWGPDRLRATRSANKALRDVRILGVHSNRDYLLRVLQSETWQAGETPTSFVALHPELLVPPAPSGAVRQLLLSAAVAMNSAAEDTAFWPGEASRSEQRVFSAAAAGRWELRLRRVAPGEYRLGVDDEQWSALIVSRQPLSAVGGWRVEELILRVGERQERVTAARRGAEIWLQGSTLGSWRLEEAGLTQTDAAAADRVYRSPMPAAVVAVEVAPGQRVEPGQTLLVLESMKMQSRLQSRHAGTVHTVHVQVGATVVSGEPLVAIEAEASRQ
jgi:geranyl-CoA carboxylase alpha subunit